MIDWILVVVTAAGIVSSSHYPTEALCKDAESLARNGQTVAEKKSSDERAAEARRAWFKEHPPRAPRTDAERIMVDHVKNHPNDGEVYIVGARDRHVTKEGLIQEDYPLDMVFMTNMNATNGMLINSTPVIDGSVRQSRCIKSD